MTDITLSGRCLCGAVHYEVTGNVLRFLHCHCERCRRASGTGHASNIILNPASVEWQAGESVIRRFKLPEAQRFATTFCATCGGPLPREFGEMVVLPAGTLDAMPDLEPQARIFWDSRAPWSCEDGNLPAYSEYPTG
ncbi:GFA family protein [Candidatus Rariloculus sp.]|uniref:GFA family protein n=1 Tax=Candidatus Rariloculus sp. TaxID=3101265 RepID=UPI003D10175F